MPAENDIITVAVFDCMFALGYSVAEVVVVVAAVDVVELVILELLLELELGVP